MRALMLAIALGLAVAPGGDASACQEDADCGPGSRCERPQGRIDGVCVDDAPPPAIDEQETVESPPIDDDAADGAPCQTHEDCGVGGRCVRQPGAAAGTCAGGM